MSDGALIHVDGRPALRFERRLPHPVARVWRAVTEPAELERWFIGPVPWTPEPGETFEVMSIPGAITELDPERRLAWRYGGERFSFDLRADGDGCVLVFTHVLDTEGFAAQHAAGWETYLARLDAHLGGGHLSEEDAHGPIADLHERYAARFGLDPAPGRAMISSMGFRDGALDAEGAFRLERHLAHPVERVWRALTEPDELARWFPGKPLAVSERDEPRLLAGTWFGEPLRFELRPRETGCLLVLTQGIEDPDTAARTAAGWDRCVARLEALLAGTPMGEAESLADWPRVHERYAAAFGVDPEVGRRAFAAHAAG